MAEPIEMQFGMLSSVV